MAIPFPYTSENLEEKQLSLINNWVGKNMVVEESSSYGPLFKVNEPTVGPEIFQEYQNNEFQLVKGNIPEKLKKEPIPGHN